MHFNSWILASILFINNACYVQLKWKCVKKKVDEACIVYVCYKSDVKNVAWERKRDEEEECL